MIKIRYTEKLRSGGTLVIGTGEWYIKFCPNVPDTRYKPREFCISGIEIDEYREAYQVNFQTYQSLLKEKTDKTDILGEKNMKIRFGAHRGVCLYDNYFPIRTKRELSQMLNDLQYAKQEALERMNR